MAKRTAQPRKKLFNLNLESLLNSEFSQEEQNDPPSEPFNQPKKLKSKENVPVNNNAAKDDIDSEFEELQRDDYEDLNCMDDINDVSKFFENVGNDFTKSMQVKKMRLGQFTDAVLSLYQTKITEMIKKQELEIDNFKKHGASDIEEEMNKFEEEFKKLKQQENKMMKLLEQQLKMIQKTSMFQEQWIENFAKLHQNFIQGYKELKNKHKNEALDLKKALSDEAVNIQKKFVMDAKREEMQTMKKYITSVYF